MNKFTLAVLLMLSSGAALSQGQEKKYSLELTDPDQPMSLEVELRNGSATIEGYSGKTVEITAVFTPMTQKELENDEDHQHSRHRDRERSRGRKGQQQQSKKQRSVEGLKSVKNASMNLEIEESDNEVEITSDFSSTRIDLVVKVPLSAALDVELYKGGDVRVSNLSGAIEIETWKGDIYASGISGPIVAETHQRDIEVVFASLSKENPSSLTTYSGDIDVTLANKIGAKVNVQNYQGETLSGLDAEFVPSETIKRNNKGNKQEIVVGGQVSATVNGGGQEISLITYSGNVYLRKP